VQRINRREAYRTAPLFDNLSALYAIRHLMQRQIAVPAMRSSEEKTSPAGVHTWEGRRKMQDGNAAILACLLGVAGLCLLTFGVLGLK
jgi:hypothetical protein